MCAHVGAGASMLRRRGAPAVVPSSLLHSCARGAGLAAARGAAGAAMASDAASVASVHSGTHPLLVRAQAALLEQATSRTQNVNDLLREKRNELKARGARVDAARWRFTLRELLTQRCGNGTDVRRLRIRARSC